jgi:shikimate kinase
MTSAENIPGKQDVTKNSRNCRHIFLTGFMGSGKTTVGKKIARSIGWPFFDCDHEIEKLTRRSIPEIFAHEGERQFRNYELRIINELAGHRQSAVIALGGGALMQSQNLETVKEHGLLIYLKSHPDLIWQRVRLNRNRPLLISGQAVLSKEEFDQKIPVLMADREKGYTCADIIIDCGHKPAGEIAARIIAQLNLKQADPKLPDRP